MDNPSKQAGIGANGLSREALEKRKTINKINKKKLKYGCLPIIIFLGILTVIGAFVKEQQIEDRLIKENIKNVDPMHIGYDSIQGLIGQKVPYHYWDVWGYPKTLPGTDNQYWVVYLDSANISFISEKSTGVVLFVGFNEHSAINYLTKMKSGR